MKLFQTCSNNTEFWTLRDGLQLAIQLGVQYLEVKLDAKVVLDDINPGNSPNAAYSSLPFDCILLLELVVILQEDFEFFYYPPSDVVAALVSADKSGETVCRHVANLTILAA